MFRIRVFQKENVVEFETRSQHELTGICMGVCMHAGHDAVNAMRIALRAIDAVSVGKVYEGTYFQVSRDKSPVAKLYHG